MINKLRIDPSKLDKYDELLRELWSIADKSIKLYRSMSLQEKTLAGGLLVQFKSFWKENTAGMSIGDESMISTLVHRALESLKRDQVKQPPPSVFGKKTDGGLSN